MQSLTSSEQKQHFDWFDRTPWAKEIGLIALGLALGLMIGSGWDNSQKISQVWHDANRDKAAAIHRVLANVPKGAPSKTEDALTEPANCIPHPDPKPSP